MTLSLYLDEDAMDDNLVSALRLRGVDVTTVKDEHRQGRSDEQQLRFAAEQGRAIYSFNQKHYMALHVKWIEQGRSHAGIVLAQKDRYSVGEQMRRLVHLVHSRSPEEMGNRVEFLSTWGEA